MKKTHLKEKQAEGKKPKHITQ